MIKTCTCLYSDGCIQRSQRARETDILKRQRSYTLYGITSKINRSLLYGVKIASPMRFHFAIVLQPLSRYPL